MKLEDVKAGQKFSVADSITGKVTTPSPIVHVATHDAQPARAKNYVVVLTVESQISGHKDTPVVLS